MLPQAGACLRERPGPTDIVLAEQRGNATLLITRRRDGELVACTILDPDDGVAGAEVLDRTTDMPGPAGASIQTMSAAGDKAWHSESWCTGVRNSMPTSRHNCEIHQHIGCA